MRTSLVLGAGGTVGIAYHAGVLHALEEVGGFRPDDADLIVGTSAGSMVGAMIRSGLSTTDLFQASVGEHPDLAIEEEGRTPWARTFEGPTDVIRRVLGSAYVLQRSMLRVPVPKLPPALRRLFPGGFFTIANVEELLDEVIAQEWPTKPLWLVTVDVRTGRRVVLGRRVPARSDLRTAVLASCAIPGFFQPIRVGRRTLVDGGIHSSTNLDLTTKIEPDLVIAVVPMGADPQATPGLIDRQLRAMSNRNLAREVDQARRRGAQVLIIRPTDADLHAMGGINMMRREGNGQVSHVAYETTARLLSSARGAELLAPVRGSVDA